MSESKFKVGQIVVAKSTKNELPFRILYVECYEGDWFYGWNSKNAISEGSIRKLTHEEVG